MYSYESIIRNEFFMVISFAMHFYKISIAIYSYSNIGCNAVILH